MNIAIIASGGDGSGMNECLYTFCSLVKNANVIMFNRGLQGIIEDDISNLDLKKLKQERTKGGIVIKTSRSQDFLTEKGFNKCIKTLKKHNIDVLVVMGGNGSLKATKKLVSAGINCVFIPASIDNDVASSDYCIGYSTAVANAIEFVNIVNTSMRAFDRICIYEVMGRHCPNIAQSVAQKVEACYCFVTGSDEKSMLKAVKNNLKINSAPIVILQENTTPIDQLKNFLTDNLKNKEVKTEVVGYFQRGGDATKTELKMAKGFAKKAVELIKNNVLNVMISYNQTSQKFEHVDLNKE